MRAASYNPAACWNLTKLFAASVIKNIYFIPAVALAIKLGITSPWSPIAAGIAVGLFAVQVQITIKLEDTALQEFLVKGADKLANGMNAASIPTNSTTGRKSYRY
jgi:hypothetical protein